MELRPISLGAVLALCCVGCGTGGPGIYPVTGRVTYQGEPAAGAFVFLQRRGGDPQNDQTMMGLVQPDGSFAVDCGSLGKGAPPGEYDVLVRWPHGPQNHNLPGPKAGRANPTASDRLRGRYADPKRPRLHAVVRAEPNELPPFELTD